MNKVRELSVFFPAFNEEDNIQNTVNQAIEVLNKIANKWEMIVVNDGSRDNTGGVVNKLAKNNKRIRLISHRLNKGYGAAIKTGLNNCRYDLIAHMDSDGQFSFADIELLLEHIHHADLVLGFRKQRIDSYYRRILQKILWLADWFLFGLKVKDVDCGFKLFKKEVVDKIGPLITESAITETEFVVRAQKKGFIIKEVGLQHHPRLDGAQTGGKLKVIARAAKEGLWLWWKMTLEKS